MSRTQAQTKSSPQKPRRASRFTWFVGLVVLLIAGAVLFLAFRVTKEPSKEVSNKGPTRDLFRDTILTRVLSDPKYAVEIRGADHDLPGDEWRDKPWRRNVSREHRLIAISERMLGEIQPQLRQMNVTQLVRSMMLVPQNAFPEFPGVAYFVFRDGNEMILKEIESRSKKDLEVLPDLESADMTVWDGDNGSWLSLADVIHWRLLHDQ